MQFPPFHMYFSVYFIYFFQKVLPKICVFMWRKSMFIKEIHVVTFTFRNTFGFLNIHTCT